MATCKIYVHSGLAKIQILNSVGEAIKNELDDSDYILISPPDIGSPTYPFVTKKYIFTALPGEHEISITSASGNDNLIYVTDIMVVEGEMAGGYNPHSSEIKTKQVTITDDEFMIKSEDGNLTITKDGITRPGVFTLDVNGLNLQFKDAGISMNSSQGILVGSEESNYVKIDKDGLKSNGMFELSGNSGRVLINSDAIEVNDGGNSSVRMDLTGLHIKGSGNWLDIEPATLGDRLKITSETISVFQGDNINPAIQLGKTSDVDVQYGLVINGGNFKLSSDNDNEAVNVSPTSIEVRHKAIENDGEH